ncbi:hypothetical protein [Marinimicrobium sp. C2-29]|uniref:hypothetical protein n=1 Tax=Marinimicrobium sp. C2-29 TaxID=3139825 RepID=UPI003139E27C
MLQQTTRAAQWLMGAGLAVALMGCSTGRHFASLDETLSIEVLPNTSKLFVYRLSSPDDRRRNLVEVYRSPGEARQHRTTEPLGDRAHRYLRRNTERALELTGYCREGFLELDYRLSHEQMWLRGECREGATDADIDRFAEQNELKIPEPDK